MAKVIKCCPKCGSPIEVRYLYQYDHTYKICKNGKLSKNYKTLDVGPIDVAIANCANPDCDVRWNEDDFEIESDRFVDYKYNPEE